MKLETLVYTSTRIHPAILRVIGDKVKDGQYISINHAINKGLARHFKVTIPKQLLLQNLMPGEKFVFASKRGYKVYLVKDNCRVDRKKPIKQRTRKCEEIETGKLIYPDCTREVTKID